MEKKESPVKALLSKRVDFEQQVRDESGSEPSLIKFEREEKKVSWFRKGLDRVMFKIGKEDYVNHIASVDKTRNSEFGQDHVLCGVPGTWIKK